MLRILVFILLPLATAGGLVWHFWLQLGAESLKLWQLLKDQADPIQSLEASAALLVLLAGAVWRILRIGKEPPPVASALQAKAEGSIVGGNVQAKEFVGRDKTTLNIANLQIQYGTLQGEPPRSDDEALVIYKEVLASRCGDIPLGSLDRDADDATSQYRPLALERVYVDLDTDFSASAAAIDQALADGKPLSFDKQHQEKDVRLLTALEAAALNPRLELLGAPGSGKTTFVNRLCLGFAKGDWTGLERMPERLRQHLPVLVVLRDFACWLESRQQPQAGAKLLWEFIRHDLSTRAILTPCANRCKRRWSRGGPWCSSTAWMKFPRVGGTPC